MSCLNHDWTQFRCPNCDAPEPMTFLDGDTLEQEGETFRIRIRPTDPDARGRARVRITAQMLPDEELADEYGLDPARPLAESSDGCDDDPVAIHDCAMILIWDLIYQREEEVEASRTVRPDRVTW